jgi:phosphoglycolate phosphatase
LNFPIEISAVAFDLDGTLVDTLPDLHEAANRMLAGIGREPATAPVVRTYVGDGVDRLVKRLLTADLDGEPAPAVFEPALAAFREHYAELLTCASRPFPGVLKTLETLRGRGFRLAVVTNKPERFTLPLLRGLGMERYFDLVIGGDSLPRKKPDALPLTHCAGTFGISQARLLMVGDSVVDVGAARAAGSPVFCVPYGYRGSTGVHELGCDAIVPALSDCLELIVIPRS